MPNRIPTPGIKAPAVRKSPSAIPSAKPGSFSKRTSSEASAAKVNKVVKQYQERISPTGMAKAQSQMAKAQASLQAKRMKGNTYDPSGTN